ncbi:hypothetical protein PPSIR1_29658, partial [Plesiocystis pacifica SIR-1]
PPKPDARPGAVHAAAPARLEGADRPAPAAAPTPAPEAVSPAPAAAAPAPTSAAPSKPASRPAASASPEPSPASTLAAELALIHAARDATPERALEHLDAHAERFPKGELLAEREALRARASWKLGRAEDAEAAVERLLAARPDPHVLERVRAACATILDPSTTGLGGPGDGSP